MGDPMGMSLVIRSADDEINLTGWNDFGSDGEVDVRVLAEGSSLGNPEAIRRLLRDALLDGSRSVLDGHDNRGFPLKVRATAEDLVPIGALEEKLHALATRPCELVATFGSRNAEPVVMVLDSVDLKFDGTPAGDEAHVYDYILQVQALPFVYADPWVTVEALPQAVSVRTEFEDCADLTGWTASGVSIADGGDYVRVVYGAGVNSGTVTFTGTVDFTTDRYLAITREPTVGYGDLVRVDVLAGGAWTQARRVSVEAGVEVYEVGVAVSAIRFTFSRPYGVTDGMVWAYGFASLGRQATSRTIASNGLVRTIAVPGSQRSPARVLAESESGVGLGDVILYSGPDYDPSLEHRLAVGMGDQVAGADWPGTTPAETLYKWPLSEIPPGSYVAWGELLTNWGVSTTGTLRFQAELHDSSGVARTSVLADRTFTAPDAGDTELRALFQANLPGWNLPGGTTHEFGLRVSVVGGASWWAQLKWLWLFNVSDGTLVIVKAGDDPKAWVEPTALDRDTPAVLTGDGELYDALPRSLEDEVIEWGGALHVTPPMTTIYGWSSEATDMGLSATFRPAGHTLPPI